MNKITGGTAIVGGLQVGRGGDVLKGIDGGTIAIDPGSIAATTRLGVTFALAGARSGDAVIMSPPATLNDDLIFEGSRVTADDTVTVYLYNPTAAAIDDVSGTWNFLWIDLT